MEVVVEAFAAAAMLSEASPTWAALAIMADAIEVAPTFLG
jgi:hypothetical protein